MLHIPDVSWRTESLGYIIDVRNYTFQSQLHKTIILVIGITFCSGIFLSALLENTTFPSQLLMNLNKQPSHLSVHIYYWWYR